MFRLRTLAAGFLTLALVVSQLPSSPVQVSRVLSTDTKAQNAQFVDLKVNGSDGPLSVAPGTNITLSWITSGVTVCNTGNSPAPFGPLSQVTLNSTQSFVINQTSTFILQCATSNAGPYSYTDQVVVNVNATSSSSSSTSSSSSQGQVVITGTRAGPTSAAPGQIVSYTVVASNTGPGLAYNYTVSDVVDPSWEFLPTESNVNNPTVCADAGLRSIGTQQVRVIGCAVRDLPDWQSLTYTFKYRIPATAACNTTYSAHADFWAQNAGAVWSNGMSINVVCSSSSSSSSTSSSSSSSSATFAGSKTDNLATVGVNTPITYTIVINNTSAVTATNVVITDVLPANLTFTSASDGGQLNGSTVTWNVPSFPANSSRTFTVNATVQAATPNNTVLTNTAYVNGTSVATDTTTVINSSSSSSSSSSTPNADLAITKTVSPTPVVRGNTVVYTVTVTNNGPANATSLVVKDTVPTGLQFLASGSDSLCSLNGADVKCMNFDLASGASRQFLISFLVPSTYSCPATIQNTALVMMSVNSTVVDPNQSNNQTPVVTSSVVCENTSPTFTATKTDFLTTATPGQLITYTMTINNTSNVNATNVQVTDNLPADFVFTSASDNGVLALPSGGNNGFVSWTLPSLAANSSKTLYLYGSIRASAVNGTVVTNALLINGTPAAQDTTTVTGGSSSSSSSVNGLTLVKTDNRTTAVGGDQLEYQITVTNYGSSNVTNLTINDPFPTSTSFVSASDGGYLGTFNGQAAAIWNNLFVAGNGGTRTVILRVRVNDGAVNGAVVTNTASVPNGPSATDTTTITTSSTTGLQIDIRDEFDPVEPGEEFDYIIRVTNNTTATMSAITLTQQLDSDTNFRSADSNGYESTNKVVTWSGINLQAGETKTFRSTVKASSSLDDGDELRSTATATSSTTTVNDTEKTDVEEDGGGSGNLYTQCNDGIDNDRDGRIDYPSDPDCSSRSDNSEGSSIIGNQNVSLRLLADRTEANVNDMVTYSVIVTNTDGITLQNLNVESMYPSDKLSISNPGNAIVNGNTLMWTIPSLAPGEARTFTYTAHVLQPAANMQLTNTARVSSPTLPFTPNASVVVSVMTRLPQTGPSDFFRPLDNSRFLSPVSARNSGAMPAVLFTFLATFGGLAMQGARKYFL